MPIDLQAAFERVRLPDHRARLTWFAAHAGERLSWATIRQHEPLLVSAAKGIYKPESWPHALSVRQTLSSPYHDRAPAMREDGTWLYAYHAEGTVPEPGRRFTNEGLLRCMEDLVPVGVLRQVSADPPASYDVLGLALVVAYEDGYFFLEGFSSAGGHAHESGINAPSTFAEVAAEHAATAAGVFDPAGLFDARQRTMAAIVRRRGQPAFRRMLLQAYAGSCAITGCDVADVLEAAHITPYCGPDTNHPTNGMLLRADLHTLFDLKLVAVDEATLTIRVSPKLSTPPYSELQGRALRVPMDRALWPSAQALEQHRREAGL